MGAISKFEAITGVLCSVLLALVFLARGLPAERIPVAVDPLYADAAAVPFATVRPPDFEPRNPAVSDTAMVFYPWLVFMAEAIHDGELPLWTPLSGGGLPMMGNLSSALFFPTTWLSFVPAIGVGRGMFHGAWLRLALAGFFGYLLLRRLGADLLSSAISGCVAMLFGYQVVWLFYSLSNVACLLPLCLVLADRFATQPRATQGAACSFALALQFLGGHAETSLALGIAFMGWILGRGGWSGVLRFVPYGLASLALCSFQLLPFVEYLGLSKGQHERLTASGPTPEHWSMATPAGWAASLGVVALVVATFFLLRKKTELVSSLRQGVLAGLLLVLAWWLLERLGLRPLLPLLVDPDRFGNPVGFIGTPYRGPEYYPDVNGGFIGVAALCLALLHGLVGSDRGVARITLGLGVFALAFACEIEPIYSLVRQVPGFDMAAGTRMLPLFGISGAIAAGLALRDLLRGGDAIASYRGAATRVATAAAVCLVGQTMLPARGLGSEPRAVADDLEIALERPGDGEILEPIENDKAGTELTLRFVGKAHEACESVVLEIGAGRLGPLPVRDGRFEANWSATRADAGRYVVTPQARLADGTLRRGKTTTFELVRRGATATLELVRIALALLAVAVLVARPSRSSGALVFGVVAIELFWFGYRYNSFSPQDQVYPSTPVTRFLSEEAERARDSGAGPFRVLCEDVILQPNMNHAYGLEVVRAYDQLELATFDRVLAWLTRGATAVRFNAETIDYRGPLFSFFNLAYIVTARDLDGVPNLERVELPATEGTPSGRIYRNRTALPRAFVVPSATRFDVTRVNELLGDVATTAILEVEPPTGLGGRGTARFVETKRNRVTLDVETDGPAMLIITDNWYPGWEAEVDGQPVPLLRTHQTFRALEVPAGRSRIAVTYRPRSFQLGLVLAGFATLALAWGVRRSLFGRER